MDGLDRQMDLQRKGELLDPAEAERLNPLSLAYIGDTVWDMLVRTALIRKQLNLRHMHDQAVKLVNASAQARAIGILWEHLTDTERSTALRGRNAHSRHSAPHRQNPIAYAEATGLESLMGYLYLSGQVERIQELFHIYEEETHAVGEDEG